MNYKVLIGREMSVGEGTVFVNKIEKVKLDIHSVNYRINDGALYSEFDVKIAVAIAESEIEEANRPKGFFSFFTNKFGLFYRTIALDSSELYSTERGIFFSSIFGFRNYGFKKVGLFTHVRLGFSIFEFEFCWDEKREYNKGKLPDSFLDYKKVF